MKKGVKNHRAKQMEEQGLKPEQLMYKNDNILNHWVMPIFYYAYFNDSMITLFLVKEQRMPKTRNMLM